MQLSDFDYILPDGLIARYPLENRSDSRLLHVSQNQEDSIQDSFIKQLPLLLNKNDLIVFNDTKVIKARLFGQKSTGGAVEVLVEKVVTGTVAHCYIRSSKAPKVGAVLTMSQGSFDVVVEGRVSDLFVVDFGQAILPLLEKHGELPIPPYFEREATKNDDARYQTVFHDPEKSASVAAPTASLHFDDALLAELKAQGIQHAFVTLHVGAGTFAPVRTDNILEHTMHSEYADLSQHTADMINETKAHGGKVIAVGTTVTRVLETVAKQIGSAHLQAWSGDTNIFIYPGFDFKVIDRLLTNFHLPKSTLLMLVSAFSGTEEIKQAYQHAILNNYRFFSYGDAMLLDKKV